MIWLYWLMNAVAPVLAGIAIIYIVGKLCKNTYYIPRASPVVFDDIDI